MGRGWGGACTRGVGELERDSLVWDPTHIAHGHLAGVAGIVLGPQVLQLQDLRLTLGGGGSLESGTCLGLLESPTFIYLSRAPNKPFIPRLVLISPSPAQAIFPRKPPARSHPAELPPASLWLRLALARRCQEEEWKGCVPLWPVTQTTWDWPRGPRRG